MATSNWSDPERALFDFDAVRIITDWPAIDNHGGLSPVWSPDGSLIAFSKISDIAEQDGWCRGFCTSYDLWIADGDGSQARLLVPNGSAPAWSPEGRWLYYWAHEHTEQGGHVSTDLHRIRPDGTGETLLYRGEPNRSWLVPPAALPDGRLAFLLIRPDPERPVVGRREIAFMDPESGRLLDPIPGLDFAKVSIDDFRFSPDGRYLAYLFQDALWIGTLAGDDFRKMGDVKYGDAIEPAAEFSWSADGRILAYSTWDALWVARPDGSQPEKVVDIRAFPWTRDGRPPMIARPHVSPGGRMVFFWVTPEHGQDRGDTYVVEVSSWKIKRLSDQGMLVALSPDGLTGLLTYFSMPPEAILGRRPLIGVRLAPYGEDGTAYHIRLPKYLPAGFSYLNTGIGYDDRAASIITTNYRASGGALAITEFSHPRVADIYMDPGEIIREWDASRYHVVLFDPDSQPPNLTAMTVALRWQEGPIWFEVKGNIALEEMIRVADSMSP